jgi:protease IV
MRHPRSRLVLATWLLALAPAAALAQPQPPDAGVRYVEEPTTGVNVPAAGLAGEHDAFATVVNPGGLRFVRGLHAGLALDIEDPERATAAGQGLGLFLARSFGGELVPTQALGLGIELLSPARAALDPDPGSPTRLTVAYAVSLGQGLGVGASWHHFFDDPGLPAAGLDTFDVGASARLGARWALGAVVRDVDANLSADGEPVQRRYELELVTRPGGTERVELALGGRIGEERADADAWVRGSVRLLRGTYARVAIESRALTVVDPALPGTREEREVRMSAGLELSFGSVGAAVHATAVRTPGDEIGLMGGSLLVRASSEQVPSVLGRERRIERVTLADPLDERGLGRALLALRALGRDPGVAAVFVQIDGPAQGWAAAQELRDALVALRAARKRVYVSLVNATTRDYFIASAADRIFVDPAGGLRLTGFAGTTLYFKGTFEKLGVSAEFEKIEEYKSAPEAYTRTAPSDEDLRMRTELYDGIYAELVARIAESRGIAPEAVRRIIDGGPYTAGDLLRGETAALVDAVATPEQIAQRVMSELGGVVPVGSAPRERPAAWAWPAVAVVSIDGDIVDGKSAAVPLLDRRLAGSETITGAIAQARDDARVRAIVLRIDSPGGSALASEMIAREVFKTRGVKPIICSLGNVAASGGYFAAAGCDVIFAEPTTITGSIGIFTGKFDISGLLGKLGVSWHSYERGAHAGLESMLQPYSDADRTLVKEKIRYFYERFLDTVATGRGMTRDQVDEIGRGRVWSGTRAMQVGLVDRMGGLVDALELARQRAGLGKHQTAELVWLPAPSKSILSRLLGLAGARGAAAADPALALPPAWRALREHLPASLWAQPDAVQARLPFSLVWE